MSTKLYKKLKAEAEDLEKIKPDLFEFLREGYTIEEACEVADISPDTISEYELLAEFVDETPDEIVYFIFEFRKARAEGMKLILRQAKELATTIKIGPDGETREIKRNMAPIARKMIDRRLLKDKDFSAAVEQDPLTPSIFDVKYEVKDETDTKDAEPEAD